MILSGGFMILSYQFLQEKYKNYSNPKTKIARLVKNNDLIKIGKGLYDTDKNVDPLYYSSALYSPSYVSFQKALEIHGLIPERVYTITNATYGKNKTKFYKTPVGTYSYKDVSKKAFPFGVNLIEENGYCYALATKEKALLDLLSKEEFLKNFKGMNEYLFENMRIDEFELAKFDKEFVNEITAYYKSRNIKLFNRMLQKGMFDVK